MLLLQHAVGAAVACCFCSLLLLHAVAAASAAAAAAAAGRSPPGSSFAADDVASVHFPNKNPIFDFVVSDYGYSGRSPVKTVFPTEILLNTIFGRRHSNNEFGK